MSAKAFLDTNILIYLYSKDEPEKRTIASELVLNPYSEYITLSFNPLSSFNPDSILVQDRD